MVILISLLKWNKLSKLNIYPEKALIKIHSREISSLSVFNSYVS